jgi:cyclic pyranopterin phosphate synthase
VSENRRGTDRELQDGHRRTVSYLRLSVTSSCDLRCRYCIPCGGDAEPRTVGAGVDLDLDHLHFLARVAVGLGIRKIRVTGGEPLTRRGVVPFLARLGELPGLERLVLTTNGTRLARHAEGLWAAGVRGLNVSVDSLRPDRYAAITGGGDLAGVLAGIDAAETAGLAVKLNVVVQGGVNEDEVLDFADYVADRRLCVRFIELMPTGPARIQPAPAVAADTLLRRIAARYRLVPRRGENHAGPARVYKMAGKRGSVGVISPMTCGYCELCNRIRVDAAGVARSCLFGNETVDLRGLLESGDETGLAAALRAVVREKPADNGDRLHRGDCDVAMRQVGG